ncbi:MAG: hypothetical protein J1G04_01325 [Clostridiales bacterium]|nr:hypothetical protein [Clostridiales bacterium]
MDITDTIKELFDPTFEAIGDSDLSYDNKRAMLYNLYCFACAIYPDYSAKPHDALFEYGCCFLLEPNRHPDYKAGDSAFVRTAASNDILPYGGRWYTKRNKDFIKYDYSSPLFNRLLERKVIPPQDVSPIPTVSLYAAAYLACNMFASLRPLWFTYYFYLDATNEPVDEEFDEKLFDILHDDKVYDGAMNVLGSMLIGDEAELGGGKLYDWYAPFIERRREKIFDVFEKRMNDGDTNFVGEYSTEMLKFYPENVALMNWNAASRTESIIKARDSSALDELIVDLKEYSQSAKSAVVDKYLKLAEALKKNLG